MSNEINFGMNYSNHGYSYQQEMAQNLSQGNTVVATETERMKTYGIGHVSQHTRHARRLYVGGIPPQYSDEDTIRKFFNETLAIALNEENDQSYVLSVYINQKKCFSFVELKSIELTTASLVLDGILYKGVGLKVLRANEYKPELIPPSNLKPIRLDIGRLKFGSTPNFTSSYSVNSDASNLQSREDLRLDSLVQFTNLSGLERDSVVIVGFPFDENFQRPLPQEASTALGPTSLRHAIRKSKYGLAINPEYEVDLTTVRFLDVGDVLAGPNAEETFLNLTTTVAELASRGSIPFVMGGSNHMRYYSTSGLMSAVGGQNVAVLMVTPQLDGRLLEDPRFFGRVVSSSGTPSCGGRLVCFGAQGSCCSYEKSKFFTSRGGKILWFTKDLHDSHGRSIVIPMFKDTLSSLQESKSNDSPRLGGLQSPQRSIVLSLDLQALSAVFMPHGGMGGSKSPLVGPLGLTIEELMEILVVAGANPNVMMLEVTNFVPEMSDNRVNLLIGEIFYRFSIGQAMRKQFVNSPLSYHPDLVNLSKIGKEQGNVSKSISQNKYYYENNEGISGLGFKSLSAASLSNTSALFPTQRLPSARAKQPVNHSNGSSLSDTEMSDVAKEYLEARSLGSNPEDFTSSFANNLGSNQYTGDWTSDGIGSYESSMMNKFSDLSILAGSRPSGGSKQGSFIRDNSPTPHQFAFQNQQQQQNQKQFQQQQQQQQLQRLSSSRSYPASSMPRPMNLGGLSSSFGNTTTGSTSFHFPPTPGLNLTTNDFQGGLEFDPRRDIPLKPMNSINSCSDVHIFDELVDTPGPLRQIFRETSTTSGASAGSTTSRESVIGRTTSDIVTPAKPEFRAIDILQQEEDSELDNIVP